VTRRWAAVATVAAVLTLGACGTTYIDATKTVPPSDVTTTTLAPVAQGTPLPALLTDIKTLMLHLDEQIIDDDNVPETMTRLDQLWQVAQEQIRDRNPDDVFPFQQAIDLAHSGVERERPADASKGYKVLIAAIAAYPAE
jgi:hypothetical protein